ncbi:MAG TPA: hypothetical protein VK133_02550, partial [Amoebophilaceae bacterium]|nr:hypothetical protein [Amoebophilaceae bacterium]
VVRVFDDIDLVSTVHLHFVQNHRHGFTRTESTDAQPSHGFTLSEFTDAQPLPWSLKETAEFLISNREALQLISKAIAERSNKQVKSCSGPNRFAVYTSND